MWNLHKHDTSIDQMNRAGPILFTEFMLQAQQIKFSVSFQYSFSLYSQQVSKHCEIIVYRASQVRLNIHTL